MDIENILNSGKKIFRTSLLASALALNQFLSGCASRISSEKYSAREENEWMMGSCMTSGSLEGEYGDVYSGGGNYYIPAGFPIPGMPGFIAKKSVYIANGVITNQRGEREDPKNVLERRAK